ncbi:MAG TPA: hypothetical protein VK856_14205 [Anaerolineaceae bacterium]|nr:hypothetical protein [Anaerolineaceae bacterium]
MSKNISRRDLLRAIVAGSGGFVATSFLPEKWLRPVVKSGVLPAHAQASAPTSTPTSVPAQNYVKGFANIDIYNEEDDSYVYALVSSTPFSKEFVKAIGNFKVASPHQIKIDYEPVEGEEVSLFSKIIFSFGDDILQPTDYNYNFVSSKKTDKNGYVKWNYDEILIGDQAKFFPFKIAWWFKFEIPSDSDEIERVIIDFNY